MRRRDGSEKLLLRLLSQGGPAAVENAASLSSSSPLAKGGRTDAGKLPVLITGGAGFVGCNLAHRLCASGQPVVLYDNLSRPGVEQNAAWLRETHGDLVQVKIGDVRDAHSLANAVEDVSAVFHFAAQVAVTTSLASPKYDFEVNARGTLNLLEALRALPSPPPVIFTSTNKVYGSLDDIDFQLTGDRYEPSDETVRARGIGETQRLDFYSPYGCSKGVADQYLLDYARTFGLQAVVFRMSCIYGPHQFGTEDQGWVAHFLIQAMSGQPITLYGDGKQVRDVLFVEDLVDAFLLAEKNMRTLSGQVFNIGGGPANTTSLLELLDQIARIARPATAGGLEPMAARRPALLRQRFCEVPDGDGLGAAGFDPRMGSGGSTPGCAPRARRFDRRRRRCGLSCMNAAPLERSPTAIRAP